MGRDVPFKPEATCDECGAKGAYDFMGDYFCQKCTDEAFDKEEKRAKALDDLGALDGEHL